MALGAGNTTSRCAAYSQSRRDNEVEAREELTKQLPAHAFHSNFNNCGDFNLTTKTLIATLLLLDPGAKVIQPTSTHKTSSAQYNQLRRDNETSVREKLKALVPENFFTPDIVDRSDFNPTTKVIISASLHLKEILQEPESNHLHTSNSPTPANIVKASRSEVMDLDEIPDSQDDELENLEQSFTIGQRDSSSTVRQDEALGRADYKAPRKSVAVAIPPKCIILPLPETRNTRLRSQTRQADTSSESSLSNTLSNMDTTEPRSDTSPQHSYDNYEILANLRTEQQNQDMGFDLKPPPLPKKAQVQGRWELKLKNPKPLPHGNEYIRALEQVTNRLVAKAQEMILLMEGDDAACAKQLQEAHDMCVDTIAMFEGDMETKKYRKKWMAKKAEWAKEYDLEF